MSRFVCIALFVALASSAPAAFAGSNPSSASLLAHAAGLSELRSSAGPFRIQAKIRIFRDSGPTSEGSYMLAWNSPTQWLEEVSLPAYSEQRWGEDQKIAWRRSTSYEPLRIHQLRRALDPGLLLAVDSDHRPGKSHQSKDGSLTCIPIEVSGNAVDLMTLLSVGSPLAFPVEGPELTVPTTREICLDHIGGTLARFQEPGVVFEYSDYRVLGDKRFPGKISIRDEDKLVAGVQIVELVASPSDASLFLPPKTAQEWPACAAPRPPRYLSEYQSQQFSEQRTALAAEKARAYGQVLALLSVYGVIQVDGKLQNPAIVETAGKAQDAIALEMLLHAKYAPGMCGDRPVPTEIVVRIEYLKALQDFR